MTYVCQFRNGGSAPATPGFIAVAPEWLFGGGAACAAPAIPAAESTLGSHPCVALSSAQVFPEWSNHNLAGKAFPANGDYPLNFVSHSMGSLQQFSQPLARVDVLTIQASLIAAALSCCSSRDNCAPHFKISLETRGRSTTLR
jgi:hypothetical protein